MLITSRRLVHPKTLARMQYDDISTTKELVNMLINKLKDEVYASLQAVDAEHLPVKGKNEDAVALLVKLTGLLTKLIPLERELLEQYASYRKPREKKRDESLPLQYPLPFTEEDKAILARYVADFKKVAL